MKQIKNLTLSGHSGKLMATDVFYLDNGKKKPVIVYAHGFNGFKDWGAFDLLTTQFAQAGFFFLKFNFSHNGTSPESPETFTELTSYAENNYTKELFDLNEVINWLQTKTAFEAEIDKDKIGLIGHSMGGGICILHAAEDSRIQALTTWASIAQCTTPWTSWPEERLKTWKEIGVDFTLNSRTQQQMPLHYQLYENYQENQDRLNIPAAISKLKIPVLLCHGKNDTSVSFSQAILLHHCQPKANLFALDSDHVFGRKHPWTASAPPPAMQHVMTKTISFFQKKFNF